MQSRGDLSRSPLTPIAKRFTHDEHSLETINIELQGIKHNDKGSYFYTDPKDATPEQIKASNFIARVTQAALSEIGLQGVLRSFDNNLVATEYTDPSTKIKHKIRTYVIDTKNIPEALS